jgi:hypothetical protein
MKMKTIAYIIILIILYSCSLYKINNETDCNIDKQLIINELKKQKAKIRESEIHVSYIVKNSNCCPVFRNSADSSILYSVEESQFCSALTLAIVEWKKIKGKRNIFPACTILKTSKGIYINTYYVESKLREGLDKNEVQKYIDTAIQSFRNENSDVFDEQILSEIEKKFREGIEIYYPGRWFE